MALAQGFSWRHWVRQPLSGGSPGNKGSSSKLGLLRWLASWDELSTAALRSSVSQSPRSTHTPQIKWSERKWEGARKLTQNENCYLFIIWSWSLAHHYCQIQSIRSYMQLTYGEGNGTPLQYSHLETPMNGGAWWAAVHAVAKSRTRLSDFTFTFHFHALEKEMATHSSVLAWRIPGMEEPGGLPSMGSHRVGHDWSDLAAAAHPQGRKFSSTSWKGEYQRILGYIFRTTTMTCSNQLLQQKAK